MIKYEIQKSERARHMRITVKRDLSVIVTIPKRMSTTLAERFVAERTGWIEKALAKMRDRPVPTYIIPKRNKRDYTLRKVDALALSLERLAHFNTVYGFTWKKVTIKNTSSRWGSCSKQKNLNFSYRIVHLPQELADYLVVHELCHLGELNHSPNFWKLVEKTIPNYKKLRKELKGVQ